MKTLTKAILLVLILFVFDYCKKPKSSEQEVVPISPSELTINLVSSTQATLNWVDKSTNEAGFKIERKTSNGTFGVIATTGADITTINDAGLTPNTTYTYRVYSFNNTGKSLSYTNEVTITTISLAKVTTTAISDTTGISAISGGNVTSDGGSAVTARGIVWGTSPSPTVSLTTKTTDGSGSGQFTSKIQGLQKNTKYYVRAYATNAAGTAYGNELSFITNLLDLNDGLVAYYPFNGNANDESGNGNNGNIFGATLSLDKNGTPNKAFSFNGINNYIEVPSSESINMPANQNFSICFYYKPSSIGPLNGSFHGIIGKMFPTGGTTGPNNGWQIGRNLTSFKFSSRSGNSANEFNNPACGTDQFGQFSNDVYSYFVFLFDRVIGRIIVYKDGIEVGRFDCQNLNSNFSNNYPLRIGVERERNLFTAGVLDEIRIYKRILTNSEIFLLSTL